MQIGHPSSSYNAGNPALQFSGLFSGITTLQPAAVLKRLSWAQENHSGIDVFVARNAEGNGMDVVIQSAESHQNPEEIAQTEADFEALTVSYNDRYSDQITWMSHSSAIPTSAEMDQRGFMPLKQALALDAEGLNQFKGGTVQHYVPEPSASPCQNFQNQSKENIKTRQRNSKRNLRKRNDAIKAQVRQFTTT